MYTSVLMGLTRFIDFDIWEGLGLGLDLRFTSLVSKIPTRRYMEESGRPQQSCYPV